jgi:repressor LexA
MSEQMPKNRIRELRKLKELSQGDLAERMPGERSHSLIAKLETGLQPLTHGYMMMIAKALGVRPVDLIEEPRCDIVELPAISASQLGDWKDCAEISTNRKVVSASGLGSKSFAVQMDDESLGEIAPMGGFVVVDPGNLDLVDGGVYVVSDNISGASFKRYAATPPRLEPCSASPQNKPITIGREPFIVIGRVMLSVRLL